MAQGRQDGFVIVVARNNVHLTKKAIKSVIAQDIAVDILLIDNASTDGTIQWANTKALAKVHYEEQRPLAACWNDGLRWAWQTRHSHALVCNNDIELRPDTYRLLVAHGGPFVTGVSVDSHGQLNYHLPEGASRPHPAFSCFLIRKSVTDKVGWFDEEYDPAYCEDCDYHVRMHRAGIEAVCIDLPFFHHGASTIKAAEPGEKARIERGATKSRERFRQKYGCLPGTKEYEALFT